VNIVAARKVQELASIVGENISQRRKALNLTQAQLAEKLDMGPDSLSRIENGVVAPRFQRLLEMAKMLDCAVADLFRMDSDPLSVKLDSLTDMLRPLPPDAQEDILILMMDLVRVVKNRR
jgi:transcriptional regulator with XRE-family HTH domain